MSDETKPTAAAPPTTATTATTTTDKENEGTPWGALAFALFALVAFWGGGTWLARWLWDTSWLVSVLLAPAAIFALYVVLKLWTFLR